MLGFSVQKGGKEWHGSGLRRNRSASSCVRQKVGLAQEKPPETTASNGISDPTGAKRLKRPYDSSAGWGLSRNGVKNYSKRAPLVPKSVSSARDDVYLAQPRSVE